jgi:hypothetical protein
MSFVRAYRFHARTAAKNFNWLLIFAKCKNANCPEQYFLNNQYFLLLRTNHLNNVHENFRGNSNEINKKKEEF